MARDRAFINSDYRVFLEEMKSKDLLGFGESIIDTKDAFLLAVALGINNPADKVKNRDGFFRLQYLKTADKALIGSVLLGTASSDEEIDDASDLSKSLDLCELCAETGFQTLQAKVNDAGCDNDLLERRLLKQLDLLYVQRIENDI